MKKLSHAARNIRYAVKRAQGIRIETDLRPYEKIIANVRRMDAARWPAGSLRRRMESLRAAIAAGTPPETVLPEAFALVTRACRLALEQEPYDVQVIAGLAMTGGKVAQMNTGEGKTMAAVFPACLRALSGKGFHILTANEYLARRDSEWMGAVYSLLGLTAAHVTEGMTAAEKRAAYRADITYLTARQAGFDFLADRLALSPQEPVQRELFSVLVDEADFILIDESRNPLIIARTGALSGPDPVKADETARILIPGRDYTVDREERNCFLTPAGERKVMRRHGCGGMEEPEFLPVYASIHVALLARNLLHRDVDYIVRSGRVELVDEWTGRVADNRRWPHGIQAAIEVKEGLVPRPDGKIYGKITIQHYVNLYERRAGMTATAVPAAEEFVRIYGKIGRAHV